MNTIDVIDGRDALLSTVCRAFVEAPDVIAIFLAGSLAAGKADAYSDIDLRVVVTPERHPWFVEHRRDIPKTWPEFLFNEWLPRAQHCVSHFRPFNKIDIFYYSVDALQPSPWYTLPIRVIHDPQGVIAKLLERSKGLRFEITEDEVDFSISKALAAAHEACRRARRGELLYAQTLLDEFRQHIMRADDLLFDRTPDVTLHAKFDQCGSDKVLMALSQSFCSLYAISIERCVVDLARLYRSQLAKLHDKFALVRSLESDIGALDIIEPEF